MRPKPTLLIILDGWGERPAAADNAISEACTPYWDKLLSTQAHTLISGSGADVGLPDKQMGNSEVGHLNIGAGRVVRQDLARLNHELETGVFQQNPVFLQTFADVLTHDATLHVFGLLSAGGIHAHEQHIFSLIKLAAEQGLTKICLHAFLDGRDTPPKSAASSLTAAEDLFKRLEVGHIGSVTGRYYAMDRDQRWERIQPAYDLLTLGQAKYQANSALTALEQAYARDETDEFVYPTLIGDARHSKIKDGDSVIFMNFRADRTREITQAFIKTDFTGFTRQAQPKLAHFVSLTEYAKDLATEIAYPAVSLDNVLGEYVANQGLTQLRIAETEKYAHVTFFINGGRDEPFANEDRILVPSPKVATYDLQPEMSAAEVTDKLVAAIQAKQYDLIICNYANADMVGHTGNLAAAKQAIETLDTCLSRVGEALLAVGGEALVTADHGNAEMMFNPETGQAHTAHTNLLVPLVYIGARAFSFSDATGVLADIAPSILFLMGLPQPAEMTGRNLFKFHAQ